MQHASFPTGPLCFFYHIYLFALETAALLSASFENVSITSKKSLSNDLMGV